MEGSDGFVTKGPVIEVGSTHVVPFVKYFRLLFNLGNVAKLRSKHVCFQVCDFDDRVTLIFNRIRNPTSIQKIFKFSGVWCLKLTSGFWSGLGLDGMHDDLYVMRTGDGSYRISADQDKLETPILIQVFGSDTFCVLPFSRFIDSNDDSVLEYTVEFEDGVCILTPLLYPNEISLMVRGNGIFIPIDSFYDKLTKSQDCGKEYVSIRVVDKDRLIEFIK